MTTKQIEITMGWALKTIDLLPGTTLGSALMTLGFRGTWHASRGSAQRDRVWFALADRPHGLVEHGDRLDLWPGPVPTEPNRPVEVEAC